MSMSIRLHVSTQSWPLKVPFRISRGAKTHANTVQVRIEQGGFVGESEAVPYARYDESQESVQAQIAELGNEFSDLSTLADAIAAMPAGAARNALDCALWDLKAKTSNTSVATLTGTANKPVVTAQTLSLGSLDDMVTAAKLLARYPLIKVKLDKEDILAKMEAIHQVLPNAKFIIDPNESWDFSTLVNAQAELAKMNVVLLEQPLPSNADNELDGFSPLIPICADESCHTSQDLERLASKYQAINIKLDKTGGLTEALVLLQQARKQGFLVMTGCMVASSLAMAPAFVIAQSSDFVDLDGPVFLTEDTPNGFAFHEGVMSMPTEFKWGQPKVTS